MNVSPLGGNGLLLSGAVSVCVADAEGVEAVGSVVPLAVGCELWELEGSVAVWVGALALSVAVAVGVVELFVGGPLVGVVGAVGSTPPELVTEPGALGFGALVATGLVVFGDETVALVSVFAPLVLEVAASGVSFELQPLSAKSAAQRIALSQFARRPRAPRPLEPWDLDSTMALDARAGERYFEITNRALYHQPRRALLSAQARRTSQVSPSVGFCEPVEPTRRARSRVKGSCCSAASQWANADFFFGLPPASPVQCRAGRDQRLRNAAQRVRGSRQASRTSKQRIRSTDQRPRR